MRLTKNFSRDEMKCPCCDACKMNPTFMAALQLIRSNVDRPFRINSGYRCETHNLHIGSRGTRHPKGMAVDISTLGWPSDDLHYLMFELTSYGSDEHNYKTGIGIYRSHIHFDFRINDEALWISL